LGFVTRETLITAGTGEDTADVDTESITEDTTMVAITEAGADVAAGDMLPAGVEVIGVVVTLVLASVSDQDTAALLSMIM